MTWPYDRSRNEREIKEIQRAMHRNYQSTANNEMEIKEIIISEIDM